MTSGKPKVVSTLTTADTDSVSAVLYPSNKAVTWGQLVYESLYELAERAFIVHDPVLQRLYVSSDEDTIAAWRDVLNSRVSHAVFTPAWTGQSIFYLWTASGDDVNFWYPHLVSLELRKRTLWDTIDRLFSIGKPLGRQPFFTVDQFDATLRIIELDEAAVSESLAAVVPAGNTFCLTLEFRKGELLPFEGGEITYEL